MRTTLNSLTDHDRHRLARNSQPRRILQSLVPLLVPQDGHSDELLAHKQRLLLVPYKSDASRPPTHRQNVEGTFRSWSLTVPGAVTVIATVTVSVTVPVTAMTTVTEAVTEAAMATVTAIGNGKSNGDGNST